MDLPEHLAIHVADEGYEAHDGAAHDVWRAVLRQNEELVREHGRRLHPAYADGRRALALPERIPRVEELNRGLEPTGWRIVPVAGYIPSTVYVELMARRIFPVSRVLRRPEHVNFAPAPDMVHDVLGHLPLLFSAEYRELLQRLAQVMTRAVPNALDQEFFEAVCELSALKSDPASPATALAAAEARMSRVHLGLEREASEATRLRRLYVWSIEFGLTGTPRDFSVHGAALLSSPLEFRALCAGKAQLVPFSLDVVRHENAFSDVLDRYFVARGFGHFLDVLATFETREPHAGTRPRSRNHG